MEKTALGVIGGLGPLATALFMERVIEMTQAATDQDHIDMIVYNCPSIPDRTSYILDNTQPNPLPPILEIGKRLDAQGVRHIAIPCITAHYFQTEIAAGLTAELINIVEQTVAHLKQCGRQTIGVMATDGTVKSELFQREIEAQGMRAVVPCAPQQAGVMALIYDCVKSGKPVDMDLFFAIRDDLRRQGADCIILGCTELSLIKKQHPIGAGFIDAMDVLAQQAVIRCGGKLKDEYTWLLTQ